MIKLKNLLVELEFKTPEEFKKYKAKHKMRPGTVVKVAGKDKVVDDKPKDKTPVKVGDKKPKVNTKELRKDFKEKTKEYDNAYDMHTALDDNLDDYDDYDKISDKKLRDSILYDLGRLQDKLYAVSDTDAKFKDLEGVYVEFETLKKQVNGILDRQTKPKVKDGKPKSEELSKITTRYTNRLDEAGVPNHLRAGFKKLKNEEGLSIEEKDELTDAYRELVDLLTYGKFYENGKPNQRRKELSELTFDIQYALVGSKRLKPQNSQSKFESIWKKFTSMINTQIKIEEKGKRGNYIKAIRASKLDDVVDMFRRNTQRSTRKQKDLL